MLFCRTYARLVAVVVVAVGLVAGLGLTSSAEAATSDLSDKTTPTYQTNGRVSAIVTVGDTVYIGGDFTSVRPPGDAAGTGEVPRARLAAFSRTTGALLDWNPGASKSVYALAASPDGSTIYVGGNFGQIGTTTRKHFAAVSASTGALTPLVANTDYKVFVITATANRIYLGGNFTTVNSKPRASVAAVDPVTGAPDPTWAPSADNSVRAITLSPDGTSIYLGGEFTTVNGARQKNLAKVAVADGSLQGWTDHPGYPVWSIVVSGDQVYVGGNGSGGHAGSYSASGTRGWVTQTDGGVQAVELFDGVLYVGGHFDNVCVGDTAGATTGFHCPTNAATRHKLLAVDPANGDLADWNPGANSNLGVWSLAASGDRLHVGGDFTRIGHFHAQQGYATFSRS